MLLRGAMPCSKKWGRRKNTRELHSRLAQSWSARARMPEGVCTLRSAMTTRRTLKVRQYVERSMGFIYGDRDYAGLCRRKPALEQKQKQKMRPDGYTSHSIYDEQRSIVERTGN